MSREIDLEELISLSIPVVPGMSLDEINLRIEQEAACRLATDDYVKGEIDFDQLLDIFEYCEVDMDNYIRVTTDNLIIVGAL